MGCPAGEEKKRIAAIVAVVRAYMAKREGQGPSPEELAVIKAAIMTYESCCKAVKMIPPRDSIWKIASRLRML